MHYHFVRERVLSGEVELVYVPTDRQTTDIFISTCRKQQERQERNGCDCEAESDEEFDFGSAEDAKGGYMGSNNQQHGGHAEEMATEEATARQLRRAVQADRKGRGAQNQTSRGARARREAKRNRSEEPGEREEPQVELEGDC